MEAVDEYDLVPRRPRGRPMRRLGGGAFEETRSDRRCRECPKHAGEQRWCPVKACCRMPDAKVCRYGLLLNAKAQAKRRAGRGQAAGA